MKTKLIPAFIMGSLLTAGCVGAQQNSGVQQAAAAPEQAVTTTDTQAAAPVEVGNKICPVSGEKIAAPGEKGEMGEAVKYTYNGKIYNLCCPMCTKDFKKNPEKYSKIAEDEVKGQTQ